MHIYEYVGTFVYDFISSIVKNGGRAGRWFTGLPGLGQCLEYSVKQGNGERSENRKITKTQYVWCDH